jgi:hypothetical protein
MLLCSDGGHHRLNVCFVFLNVFYSLVEGKFVCMKQEERKRKRGEL